MNPTPFEAEPNNHARLKHFFNFQGIHIGSHYTLRRCLSLGPIFRPAQDLNSPTPNQSWMRLHILAAFRLFTCQRASAINDSRLIETLGLPPKASQTSSRLPLLTHCRFYCYFRFSSPDRGSRILASLSSLSTLVANFFVCVSHHLDASSSDGEKATGLTSLCRSVAS